MAILCASQLDAWLGGQSCFMPKSHKNQVKSWQHSAGQEEEDRQICIQPCHKMQAEKDAHRSALCPRVWGEHKHTEPCLPPHSKALGEEDRQRPMDCHATHRPALQRTAQVGHSHLLGKGCHPGSHLLCGQPASGVTTMSKHGVDR